MKLQAPQVSNVDRIYFGVVPPWILISVSDYDWVVRRDTLPIMLILTGILGYSIHMIRQGDNSISSRITRTMSGILIIIWTIFQCVICWQPQLELRMIVLVVSLLVIYKTQKLFFCRIKLRELALAGVLDLPLLFLLLSRA